MYQPEFRVNKSGVPVLNNRSIDIIGERYVRDFQPEVLTDPCPVDIDGFVEYYLGMTQDFQYLSHNGVYLGMTVFNDTDKIPVWCPETNTAEYISATAGTVIIDNRLLEEKQHHRYRFTMGHEGGHGVFHTSVFAYDPNQISLFSSTQQPAIQCRVDSAKRKDPSLWTDRDRMEWQANRFASAVLMPESAVRLVVSRRNDVTGLYREFTLVSDLVQTFDVSMEAAAYRLKDMGIIRKDYNPRLGLDFMEVVMEASEVGTF